MCSWLAGVVEKNIRCGGCWESRFVTTLGWGDSLCDCVVVQDARSSPVYSVAILLAMDPWHRWHSFLPLSQCTSLPYSTGAMLDILNKVHIEKGKENTAPPFMLHNLAGRSPAPLTLTSDFLRLCLPLATYCWKASGTRVESGVISNTMWYRVTALGSGGLG